MVLISILAASASSYYSGSGTIAERSFRQEMMTAAKYAQQQSMMDTVGCYRFVIETTDGNYQFGPQKDSGSGYQFFGENFPIAVTKGLTVSASTLEVYFDALGNSVKSCSDKTSVPATISVVGDTTVQFKVETTGYVHAI